MTDTETPRRCPWCGAVRAAFTVVEEPGGPLVSVCTDCARDVAKDDARLT